MSEPHEHYHASFQAQSVVLDYEAYLARISAPPAPVDFSVPFFTQPIVNKWHDARYMVPVRIQGECNCCGACAACDCISALHAIRGGRLIRLAVQHVVDLCGNNRRASAHMDKMGCKTAKYPEILGFAKIGIYEEIVYPYEGRRGKYVSRSGTKLSVTGKNHLMRHEAVAALDDGPLVASIVITPELLAHRHTQKIYVQRTFPPKKDEECHGVLVTGYGLGTGEEEGKLYYTIKNSWGVDFAHCGYGRVEKRCLRNFYKIDKGSIREFEVKG